ncbi:HET-domain-containing protein [Byssothecium circinans]|uniref:HET-domain-containing protein n=1 Tax=Byssothecium circinans TaxID=147558 RepID=A0A6A5TCH3_9PLEO|nr:HET-domain-containing protein [Byssothecium circinans]
MEAQRSDYSYTALDTTKREIRLLYLHPSCAKANTDSDSPSKDVANEESAPDEIYCTFSLASLDDYAKPELEHSSLTELKSEPFEALSYTWGDAKDTTLINLEGNRFPVTKNLHCALVNLRLPDKVRILWVDALCINQGNTNERSSQVAMMHLVYGKAWRVVVFLGESWEGCDMAMELITSLAADPTLHLDPAQERHVVVNGLDFFSEQMGYHLHFLLALPWWSRLWTVQEYAVADIVLFQCGQHLLDGAVFREHDRTRSSHLHCCRIPPHINKCIPLQLPFHDALDRAANLIMMGEDMTSLDLVKLISLTRNHECSDPRDKVYGMLGLASRAMVKHNCIQANYSQSVESVYTNLVTASIRDESSLDILSCVLSGHRNLTDLPTFVPDWSSTIPRYSANCLAYRRSILHSHFVYSASRNTFAELRITSSGLGESRGVFVDKVSTVIHIEEEPWASIFPQLQEVARIETRESPYASNLTAFWMTICGGTIRERSIPRPAEERDFSLYEKFEAWTRATNFLRLDDREVIDFIVQVQTNSAERSFIVTERGYIGMAPTRSAVGDSVVLLPGGKAAYILHPTSDFETSGHYEFLGDAYVHGIMKGEAWDETKLEPIVIV